MSNRFMVVLACLGLAAPASAVTLGTAFIYQGEVTHGSQPFSGSAKLTFNLYDAVTGGNLLGTQVLNPVPISSGIFTVQLNGGGEFGASAFNGDKRWLAIAVNDTLLTPRQEVTGSPYALFAAKPWVTAGTTVSYTAGSVCIGTSTPSALTLLNAYDPDAGAQAIHGDAPAGNGVVGTSNASGYGAIVGISSHTAGIGAYGTNSYWGNYGELGTPSEGVYAFSTSGVGVNGQTSNGTGVNGNGYNGVWGTSSVSDGNGLKGECSVGTNAYGIWGLSSTGWAGTFSGNAQVTGNFYAGAKFFRIDDPLDPANKTLIHSCVESSEMKNMYDGTVVMDAGGEAWVELPAWFESLNENFRYQLTCIGEPALVYIKQKISGNRFLIAGGKAGLEVSWQVTGVRKDAYARAHPMQVEVEKEGADRGLYLNPEAFGLPESRSVYYAKIQAAHLPSTAPRKPAIDGVK